MDFALNDGPISPFGAIPIFTIFQIKSRQTASDLLIDDLNQATPAQLEQLQGAIEAALVLQQLDAEEFKKGQC